jgi:hypothetical protein
MWTSVRDAGHGRVTSFCEHSNEPSGSVTGLQSLYYLRDYWLFKKDSTPGCQLQPTGLIHI